jgi:hypothetical protein
MRFWKLALLLLCLSPLSSFSQTAKTKPIFELGMNRSKVLRALGQPASYFCTRTRLHYKKPYCPRGTFLDAYPGNRQGRLYEALLRFDVDEDGSRLRPTLFLAQVSYVADKPISLRRMLGDFPEIAAMCTSQCQIGTERIFADSVTLKPCSPARGKNFQITFSWNNASYTAGRDVRSFSDDVTEAIIEQISDERAASCSDGNTDRLFDGKRLPN